MKKIIAILTRTLDYQIKPLQMSSYTSSKTKMAASPPHSFGA